MADCVGSAQWDRGVDILPSLQLASSLAAETTLTIFHGEVDRNVPMLPVLELEDLAVLSSWWVARNWWQGDSNVVTDSERSKVLLLRLRRSED